MVVIPVARPSLNRSLDALLGTRYLRSEARSRDGQSQLPAMDVVENDKAYVVILDVPGVTRDALKVSVQGRRIEVEANGALPDEQPEGQRVVFSERAAARYARTITLPAEVDSASSQAKLENGVLTLTLNKRVPTGATQLAIE